MAVLVSFFIGISSFLITSLWFHLIALFITPLPHRVSSFFIVYNSASNLDLSYCSTLESQCRDRTKRSPAYHCFLSNLQFGFISKFLFISTYRFHKIAFLSLALDELLFIYRKTALLIEFFSFYVLFLAKSAKNMLISIVVDDFSLQNAISIDGEKYVLFASDDSMLARYFGRLHELE